MQLGQNSGDPYSPGDAIRRQQRETHRKIDKFSSISLTLALNLIGLETLSASICTISPLNSPITSADLLLLVNQESSPNFPTLYLARRSFGKPHTTLMKCGLDRCRAVGSKKVENLFFIKRDKARIVIIEDCIVIITALARSHSTPF